MIEHSLCVVTKLKELVPYKLSSKLPIWRGILSECSSPHKASMRRNCAKGTKVLHISTSVTGTCGNTFLLLYLYSVLFLLPITWQIHENELRWTLLATVASTVRTSIFIVKMWKKATETETKLQLPVVVKPSTYSPQKQK